MKKTNSIYETLLQFVKFGLGISKVANNPHDVDWNALKALADKQGVSAVVLDALNSDSTILTDTIPVQMKLEWIGEVLRDYELRYELYKKAISDLAGFYNAHGYKMMLLKGYGCSLNWPKPNHRPCGDIDIWLFGLQAEADLTLAKETGFKIDGSHEHHTIFGWKGFMVENHYDFIGIHHRKSSTELEQIFKELGKDDTHRMKLKDVSTGSTTKVYLPSPNLHALFLLRHCMEHFASAELTIRQLLDWAFFVEKHTIDIDWKWLEGILDKFGMLPAYSIFNAICVNDLEFDKDVFPKVQFDPLLKERVLKDILEPEFCEVTPEGLLSRMFFKYHRWRSNGWKNDLCFKESMWSAFWSGVWGHILKPGQI